MARYNIETILSKQRIVPAKHCPHCGGLLQKKCLLINVPKLPVGFVVTDTKTGEIVETVYINSFKKEDRKIGTKENLTIRSRGDLMRRMEYLERKYYYHE